MVNLTERQKKVLDLIAKGFTNEEIGKKLKCTTSNIESFVFRLQAKFQANNKASLVAKAFRAGVLN